MMLCRGCGKELTEPVYSFCPHCGGMLTSSTVMRTTTFSPNTIQATTLRSDIRSEGSLSLEDSEPEYFEWVKLVGKRVLTLRGKQLGFVNKAVCSREGRTALLVRDHKGQETIVPTERVKDVGEVIVIQHVSADEPPAHRLRHTKTRRKLRASNSETSAPLQPSVTSPATPQQTGVLDVNGVRTMILPKKIVDILVQKVGNEYYQDVGREIGEVIVSYGMLRGIESANPAQEQDLLHLITELGLGTFTRNQDRFVVQHAALPAEVNLGILEEIFRVKLQSRRTVLDVQLFQPLRHAAEKQIS